MPRRNGHQQRPKGGAHGKKRPATSTSALDVAADVAQHTQATAQAAVHKAEDAVTALGGEMQQLAQTVRTQGPHSGVAGTATSAVARGLDTGGRFLQEQSFADLKADFTQLVRRHPLPALAVGIGIGILVACAVRR